MTRRLRIALSATASLLCASALGAAQQVSFWPTTSASGSVSLATAGSTSTSIQTAYTGGGGGGGGGATYVTNGNAVFTVDSNGHIVPSGPPRPQGAYFHQVVDKYYDANGSELETQSATHVVGYDCHSGVRRQEDLVAQDDGHGGVRFAALLMGNEPVVGSQPITAEGRVKVILAARNGASPAPSDGPESPKGEPINVASSR